MREIKFRVYDPESKLMMSWDELSHSRMFNIQQSHDDIGWEWMQYTGLKDKNGKEIYEGDIYKTIAGETPNGIQKEETYRIKFNHGAFTLVKLNGFQHGVRYLGSKTNLLNGEVIGNIWENPELLK